MENMKWLWLILLICNALPIILSLGELEEAMQWMMMEEVSDYVKGGGKQQNQKSKDVEFVLYKKGPSSGAPAKVDAPGTIHNGALSAKNRLRICVFGWQNDLNSEFVRSFVNLYTNKEKNFQVVVVNWIGSNTDYVGARRLVTYVAETMRKYLTRLEKDLKIDLSRLIIIGHGFGAHIAGAVGHMMRGSIGTIIALDPMGPLFWENTHDTVNASSAQRVIGVHTSAGYLGVYWNVGHADFWVNRGSAPQPGCYQRDWRRAIVCSHEKSFRYFIEAVTNPHAFHAVECGRKITCGAKKDVKVPATGFFTEDTNINGQFCFNTHPTSPYSLAADKPAALFRQMRPGTHVYSEKKAPKKHRRFPPKKKKSSNRRRHPKHHRRRRH